MQVFVVCKQSDMYRVRITCRCGRTDVVEVPKMTAEALNLHPCSRCGWVFVAQRAGGKWQIRRYERRIQSGDVIGPI